MIRLMNDAKHWRERAEEVRAVAETMNDGEARRLMQGIAESYDHLAERAEQRVKQPPLAETIPTARHDTAREPR